MKIAECREEAAATPAGVARRLTTRASQDGASIVSVILVEPALESLAGKAQSTMTQSELELGEIVAGVLA